MKIKKISLANIKGKLGRDEMKKINGGACMPAGGPCGSAPCCFGSACSGGRCMPIK